MRKETTRLLDRGLGASLVAVCLLGSSAAPAIEAGQNAYESLPLQKREWKLIEAARLFEVQAEARGDIYRHPGLEELIRRIGSQLAPPPTDPYLEYRFHILRNPHPGAFALADGQVYVNVGMLAVLENEAQLATLLAHEINHVASHHGIRHYRNSGRRGAAGFVGLMAFSVAVAALGGDPPFEPTSGASKEMELPKQSVLGYRRSREEAADRWAIQRIAEIGYDVREACRLFEILGRDAEGERVGVETKWSPHPRLLRRADRLRRIASEIGEATDLDTLHVGAARYRELRWRVSLDTVHEYIRAGYASNALSAAARLVEKQDDDPEAHFALAEAYLALGDQGEDGFRNAMEEYSRTLSLDSDFAQAHRGMGLALLRTGSLEEAAQELDIYLGARPEAPDRQLVLHHLKKIEPESAREDTEGAAPRPASAEVSASPPAGQQVIIGKTGKRPLLPGPDPRSGSIGVAVNQNKLRFKPGGSGHQATHEPGLKAKQIFFVKLEDGDETLGEGAFGATDLIASDFFDKELAFLLNAEPGRYVAVAAVLDMGTIAFFSMAMISETDVTVGPQEMAFMGEYSVSTSTRMKKADEAQAHYSKVLLPRVVRRGPLAWGSSGLRGSRAGLKKFAKDIATEREFWIEARDTAFEHNPRWQVRVRRQLSVLAEQDPK